MLKILNSPEPLLKDEDYPEFRAGSEDWVRQMRDQDLHLEKEKAWQLDKYWRTWSMTIYRPDTNNRKHFPMPELSF